MLNFTKRIIDLINGANPANMASDLGGKIDRLFFSKTVILTAAAAGTAVEIIPDSDVPAGKKIYLLGAIVNVGGATAWADATATKVSVLDTNASPVEAVAIAKAGLTANANLFFGTANVTLATAVSRGLGLTEAKGIVAKSDANFGAGSDLSITVFGCIK